MRMNLVKGKGNRDGEMPPLWSLTPDFADFVGRTLAHFSSVTRRSAHHSPEAARRKNERENIAILTN